MKKKQGLIPQWTEDIKPFRDTALFWNSVWQSAGRPLNNALHNVMKRTRNVYHLHIRKNKRMVNTLKKNKILAACFGDNQLDLFKEIKKIRKSPPSVATTIDGESENIPNHFAKIYKELYNSVSDDTDVENIRMMINGRIDSTDEVKKVTPEIVKEATTYLKANKTDPVYNFNSDCMKNAPNVFYEHLADIFQEFLIHEHVSSVLLFRLLYP